MNFFFHSSFKSDSIMLVNKEERPRPWEILCREWKLFLLVGHDNTRLCWFCCFVVGVLDKVFQTPIDLLWLLLFDQTNLIAAATTPQHIFGKIIFALLKRLWWLELLVEEASFWFVVVAAALWPMLRSVFSGTTPKHIFVDCCFCWERLCWWWGFWTLMMKLDKILATVCPWVNDSLSATTHSASL